MKRCKLKILSCGSCKHPEFMTKKNGSLCPVDFPSLVGVIEHSNEGIILFDTGYDQAFFDATQTFPERFYRWATPVTLHKNQSAIEQLKALGYQPSDVSIIIISHFHGDHVSGLHNFPKARIICSKVGLKNVYQGNRFGRVRQGILSSLIPIDIEKKVHFFEDGKTVLLPQSFTPFADAVDILGDKSLLAVELPGHCSGHWGLILRTKEDRYVFLVADAAWSSLAIESNTLPPKLTLKLLGSTPKYSQTLNNLNILKKNFCDIFILPSHCNIAINRFHDKEV